MGRTLVLIGALVLLSGLLLMMYPNLFDWFGRLPGDLRIRTRSGVIFLPLASMLLLSIVLTVLINIIMRW